MVLRDVADKRKATEKRLRHTEEEKEQEKVKTFLTCSNLRKKLERDAMIKKKETSREREKKTTKYYVD